MKEPASLPLSLLLDAVMSIMWYAFVLGKYIPAILSILSIKQESYSTYSYT